MLLITSKNNIHHNPLQIRDIIIKVIETSDNNSRAFITTNLTSLYCDAERCLVLSCLTENCSTQFSNLIMQKNTNYNYKVSNDFVIENGVLIGAKEPYVIKHSSFGELILERLRARPEFLGQIDGITGKEECFAEMTENSVKCAMWMKKQNVTAGDVIGICTGIRMDMYVPCLASLYLGAIFNPWWNVGITKDMTRHFLTLTRPKILFADEASAELAVEVAKEIELPLKVVVFGNLTDLQSLNDILASEDKKNVAEFKCTKLSSHEEPALILFTSGSTGTPKGALHPQISLFGNVDKFNKLSRVEGTTISLMFSTLAWNTGTLNLLSAIVGLQTRIVHPEFTEEITFQLIEKFKVNWMFLGTSPTVRLQKSPALPKYDLSSLRYFYVGGSVLKEETQKAMALSFPQTKLLQVYGMTELGGVALEQDVKKPKSGSCGKVVKNISMKVIDNENEKVLGPNETGEACFKSPFMMTKYYKNPKVTNETIDAEGWLHTGDLVHYDEEGNVFITDRMKEMIKYRGYHVSPAMVEQILQAHPKVSEAAVVAKSHDVDIERPMAFVALKPNTQVKKEDLEKLVTDKLPDYMKLRGGVEFLEVLPHTPSGKISRSDLKKLAQSGKFH